MQTLYKIFLIICLFINQIFIFSKEADISIFEEIVILDANRSQLAELVNSINQVYKTENEFSISYAGFTLNSFIQITRSNLEPDLVVFNGRIIYFPDQAFELSLTLLPELFSHLEQKYIQQ